MAQHETNEQGEKMVLAHDPVDGFRPLFYVVFTVGVAYLAYVLFTTL